MTTTSDIIVPQTVAEMVATYQKAEKDIRIAYELLEQSKQRLCAVFGDTHFHRFDTIRRDNWLNGKKGADETMLHIKKDAWTVLAEKMELRRTLSIKAREELDKQLQKPADLPEVTEANIWSMWEKTVKDFGKNISDAVKEVYNWLRPRGDRFKTNSQFKVGRKVVLDGIVSCYSPGYYSMSSYYDQNLTALENVMMIMDGRGTIKTYHGPLYDAMYQAVQDRAWNQLRETEYFAFRLFKKGTAHIEFKRLDLVDKLNKIAGGDMLPQGEATAEPPPKESSETAGLLLTQ